MTAGTGVEREKVLRFGLASECYGIAVRSVREVLEVGEITPLPCVPDYVEGVMNLHGRIVPVIDLRKRLGLPAAPWDVDTRVVVTAVELFGSDLRTACVVDRLHEIVTVDRRRMTRRSSDARDAAEVADGGSDALTVLDVEWIAASVDSHELTT